MNTREIKFKYIFDATENGLWIESREFTIEQIEQGEPYNFMDCCFTTSAKITRLQYIGRKDKNGKDIYDGDILEARRNTKNPIRWVMEWHERDARWSMISPIEEFEIIGNIYENPELIPNK